jgi:hypothetical protein
MDRQAFRNRMQQLK